jgi:hypothetical protein
MLQKKYIKIDGTYSTEPPRMPGDDLSLMDKFASIACAPFRKSTCSNLRQAFNNLCKSEKVANEHGRPHTVQIMQSLKFIEGEVTRITSTIEAGGVAGLRALREARDFLMQDLESRVLQPS